MRTRFYYLTLAVLAICWQLTYVLLPLPQGDTWTACEGVTLGVVLVQAAVPTLLATQRESLTVLNYGFVFAATAAGGVQAVASLALVALEAPVWLVLLSGVVMLTREALLLLEMAYGRGCARDVEQEHGTEEVQV